MWHDYLALPEVRFFLRWWWAEFSLIALVGVPAVLIGMRADRRGSRR